MGYSGYGSGIPHVVSNNSVVMAIMDSVMKKSIRLSIGTV
jgi:hypothetical protein